MVSTVQADHIFDLQNAAVKKGSADFGHWGWEKDNYKLWSTHSNRLIPVYTFGTLNKGDGVDLSDYTGENSVYRSPAGIRKLYDYVPLGTVNPSAEYLDQTNIADIQLAALNAGKKNIILVVFDGMDWQTTQLANIAKHNKIAYTSGRGTGLHFQDYTANGTTQFSYMVTSPHNDGTKPNPTDQTLDNIFGGKRGGYSIEHGGATPWAVPSDRQYLIGKAADRKFQNAYTDSSCSASSMTAGVKSYNGAVNIDANGAKVTTIAHVAQQRGYRIGVVTSVPISHATPAAAYSHNVKRSDYQDLTRDLIGRPSIAHPKSPLEGVDVLIGCGYGESRTKDSGQGDNFVAGNAYLTEEDRQAIDSRNGGKYAVAIRTEGINGSEQLKFKAEEAIEKDSRLFGFFGVKKGHLPFRTADGDYKPANGRANSAEKYTENDLAENPTLAEMAGVALDVLSAKDEPFWLMVESGDVDWANHDNNIDNSSGAVVSGDDAVKVLTEWVEKHSSWDETVMIVTADHGHYLVLEDPSLLISK